MVGKAYPAEKYVREQLQLYRAQAKQSQFELDHCNDEDRAEELRHELYQLGRLIEGLMHLRGSGSEEDNASTE